MHKMAATLEEVGLVTFLRNYLRRGDGGQIPSLRKLILGFGIIPVSDHSLHPHQCASRNRVRKSQVVS